MDLYDGGSMKQWLNRRGPLSGAQAAGVGAKIAGALHAAHELGVLHRDVKPNNILVSRYGEPALADFGVSWLLDASNSSSVLDVFSPQHAAPELMTRGVPTASSDVYALGSSLYELLAGRPPFGAPGQDVRRTIYLALSEPAPRLECPDLPGFAEVIERAMAKDPADRYPDAASFASALRALIPDGRSAALVMEDAAAATAAISLGTEVPPAFADPSRSVDMTDAMYLYAGDDDYISPPDETMVRPDRVDEDAVVPGQRGGSGSGRRRPDERRPAENRRAPDAGRGGRGGGYGNRDRAVVAGGGAREGRGVVKPLALVAVVALVLVGAWALVTSQGSASSDKNAAVTPGQTSTAGSSGPSGATSAGQSSSSQSSSHSSSSSSPSTSHHTSTSALATHTVTATSVPSTSAAVPPPSVPASATSPLLSANYHRYRNSGGGTCLAQAGGAAAQACAENKGQGWEFTAPLTDVLGSLTGQEELVNGDGGGCLTGGAGGVSVKSCNGSLGQLWSKSGGSGGATQLQNASDALCLKASGGSVTEAACDGDPSEMWAEAGGV